MHTKRTAYYHAATRALERYNIPMSLEDVEQLSIEISQNKHFHVKKFSNTKKLYFVNYHGAILLAVYKKEDKVIITFLPMDIYLLEDFGLKLFMSKEEWELAVYKRIDYRKLVEYQKKEFKKFRALEQMR